MVISLNVGVFLGCLRYRVPSQFMCPIRGLKDTSYEWLAALS
jgi:hypothetical protein